MAIMSDLTTSLATATLSPVREARPKASSFWGECISIWGRICVPNFRENLGALWSHFRTIPKLLFMALILGMVLATHIALTAFVDVTKDKAEGYATDWTETIFRNPTAQRLLAKAFTLAVHYPTATVVAVFLVMLLVVVIVSAIQVRQTPPALALRPH